MDPVTAIGLALAIIKLIMAVMDFLHAHPYIAQEAKAAITAATASLASAVGELSTVQPYHFEGA